MKTYMARSEDIQKKWHVVNAEGKIEIYRTKALSELVEEMVILQSCHHEHIRSTRCELGEAISC